MLSGGPFSPHLTWLRVPPTSRFPSWVDETHPGGARHVGQVERMDDDETLAALLDQVTRPPPELVATRYRCPDCGHEWEEPAAVLRSGNLEEVD